MQAEKHFRATERLLREVSKMKVANWLLNEGYFPENHILPPSFCASNFTLKKNQYNKNISTLKRRSLVNITYPKTALTSRKFGIYHPWNYHNVVLHIYKNWEFIVDHLFNKDIKIYSYSLPIPVTAKNNGNLSKLRSGRMIYEWIEMAEKDLIQDTTNYKVIARTDITNFYASIYTHSIGWALHGREEAFNDKKNSLFGNKIDKLIQYSNDVRTNGIPVGSALSDLIAEIILTGIDRKISKLLSGIKYNAVRFKDDYRILCKSEDDARFILKVISNELSINNLVINESKTSISNLPDGLYRKHDREYFPHSLHNINLIDFKVFEHTLLIALDIHRSNIGTSILEKFISELFSKDSVLKINFSTSLLHKDKQIKKMISLLFLMKRESHKILSHVLSVTEQLYVTYRKEYPDLKEYIKSTIKSEIIDASKREAVFEVVWLVYFSRYIGLGIQDFNSLVDNEIINNNGTVLIFV